MQGKASKAGRARRHGTARHRKARHHNAEHCRALRSFRMAPQGTTRHCRAPYGTGLHSTAWHFMAPHGR
eukprot:13349417-Alexandrium_andersonii.AAC.1